MAVYRQGLVIPPSAKVLPPKNEKPPTAKIFRRIALPPKKYRHVLVLPLLPQKVPTLDTAKKYRQLSIPPKEYRQLSIPPKRYRQHCIPPKWCRRHWISPKRYRRYWIPPKRYRVHAGCRPKSTGFCFRVRSLFFVVSGYSGSFSVEGPLCGRVDRETPPHLPVHLPPRLPTPRSAWFSRTMSGLEGNPSATSS